VSRWGQFFSRRERMMEGLDQEIRDHIACETEDNIKRGMLPEEARYAALRKFGNVTRVKEDTWEVWSCVWLEQLWQQGSAESCAPQHYSAVGAYIGFYVCDPSRVLRAVHGTQTTVEMSVPVGGVQHRRAP